MRDTNSENGTAQPPHEPACDGRGRLAAPETAETAKRPQARMRIDWALHQRNLLRGLLETHLDIVGQEIDAHTPLIGVIALPDGEWVIASSPPLARDEIEHLLARAIAEVAER